MLNFLSYFCILLIQISDHRNDVFRYNELLPILARLTELEKEQEEEEEKRENKGDKGKNSGTKRR